MKVEKLLELYIKNMKLNTSRSYKTTLKLWADFITRNSVSYEKASTLDAFHFFDYLTNRKGIDDKKAANGTVHSRIKTMRKVYQVLVSEGVCKTNIFQTSLIKLKHPRANMKRQTQSIPQSLIKPILKYKPKNIKERQALCLIALMYGGGLRISEALGLNLADIRHSDKGTLYVLLRDTKNGTDAKQALPAWCYRYLIKQVTQRRLESGENLFVTYGVKGKVLSENMKIRNASRHTKKILRVMGLKKHSNHSLRKTSINYLVDKQYPVVEVQKFARHKSIISTQGYFNECQNIDNNLASKIVLVT